MAKIPGPFLDAHEGFPRLTLKQITGEVLHLPEGLGPGYGVVLFYRGHW